MNLRWPPLSSSQIPRWDGHKFWVGQASVPFLAYSQNLAGWSDDLTSLHRRESGGLHPIDITSRHNALAALRKALPNRPTSVLEVGSSEGHLLRDLRKAYPEATIVGSEVAAQALRHIAAEQPGIPLLQLDILNCPLPAESFDAVIALNVLEHIEDDVTALANMARLLAVGGILIVEVPAGPGLYDSYDRQLRHYRRYTMTEIKRKIMQAELKVECRTHVGCLVYPAFALVKKTNRFRSRQSTHRDVVTSSIRGTHRNRLLGGMFALERAMFNMISWPFGIRSFIVARKI